MTTNAVIYSDVIRNDIERAQMIAALRLEPIRDEHDRELIVVVKRWVPSRTLAQNRLWQAWTTILAEHTGCTHGEMKRALERELLGEQEVTNPITGETTLEPIPAESLDVPSFKKFLDQVRDLALTHFGVQLPDSKDKAAWLAFRKSHRKAA